MELLLTKEQKRDFLKFYIDSNNDTNKINNFVKKNNITIDYYNNVINDYLEELRNDSTFSKKIDPLYLEYTLKYSKNVKGNKRKEAEQIINIIFNYIKEDKNNIKEYVTLNGIEYSKFKKFINNFKNYYLTDMEKQILKNFLKRENDFNKNNLLKVKKVIELISDDLVNDKPYDIYNYYIDLGWDQELLLFFLNNNKDVFSSFIIENVKIYFKKYHITSEKIKLTDFMNTLKKEYPNLSIKDIESNIKIMNSLNMPYNLYLFSQILKRSE